MTTVNFQPQHPIFFQRNAAKGYTNTMVIYDPLDPENFFIFNCTAPKKRMANIVAYLKIARCAGDVCRITDTGGYEFTLQTKLFSVPAKLRAWYIKNDFKPMCIAGLAFSQTMSQAMLIKKATEYYTEKVLRDPSILTSLKGKSYTLR